MKHIKITVSVDGNDISRDFQFEEGNEFGKDWNVPILAMLNTIEKSEDSFSTEEKREVRDAIN